MTDRGGKTEEGVEWEQRVAIFCLWCFGDGPTGPTCGMHARERASISFFLSTDLWLLRFWCATRYNRK